MVNLFKNKNEDIWCSVKGITWFDKKGILPINDDIYVEIKLDDIGTSNNFNLYHVVVYHKLNGKLSHNNFRFSDYMKVNHMWLQGGNLDWYVVRSNGHEVPTSQDLKKFVNTIMDYIKLVTPQ